MLGDEDGDDRWLIVRNRCEDLPRVDAWAERLSLRLSLHEQACFALRLCLAEAITNIIDYAFIQSNDGHDILISWQEDTDRVMVTIEDDGIAFNPLLRPEPKMVHSVEQLCVGGNGINLIRRFSSTVTYERVGNLNRLTFVVNRRKT